MADQQARKRVPSADTYDFGRVVSKDGHPEDPLAVPEVENVPLDAEQAAERHRLLVLSFCAMVFIGLGNKIFQKLQTIPMRNYPNFLNLLTTWMYIPLSFAYVFPAIRAGWISPDQFKVPKKKFAVMGFLDCIAGIMQIFAATYLPGSLLILLLQSAIPVSMALSALIMGSKYHKVQYVSAVIVCGGIILVLAPELFSNSDDDDGSSSKTILWSVVLIASCVPMCLSSIYKELALGQTELDPVYLNAWIAVFQFLFSLPLAVPAALASDPPVYPKELPENLADGLRCYFGVSSIQCDDDDDSCSTDACNPDGPIFVNIYLMFNVMYNILIIMILKWGSANILWLAMTVMVPLGNLAFALPFMPENSAITFYDILGLVVIMAGLVGYRAGPKTFDKHCGKAAVEEENEIIAQTQSPFALDKGLEDERTAPLLPEN
uniref:EamA domain-containing protein n=1 Tax=Rhizochromulina marina TaxID=1034831 RepID=A0A7S2RKK2_9STRA|mmetsp:Transcript_1765/g.5190  ORF Transcript_1765/g.5190 Transcript_1765/m.5190 type:complete len:434 (+) Transcript_1765:91-1392(+)